MTATVTQEWQTTLPGGVLPAIRLDGLIDKERVIDYRYGSGSAPCLRGSILLALSFILVLNVSDKIVFSAPQLTRVASGSSALACVPGKR